MIKPNEIPMYLEIQRNGRIEEISDLLGLYPIETIVDNWIAHYFNTDLQVADIPYNEFINNDDTNCLTEHGPEILFAALSLAYGEYWTITHSKSQGSAYPFFKFIPKTVARDAND